MLLRELLVKAEQIPQAEIKLDRWRVRLSCDVKVNECNASVFVELCFYCPLLIVAAGRDYHITPLDLYLLAVTIMHICKDSFEVVRTSFAWPVCLCIKLDPSVQRKIWCCKRATW